MDHDDIGYSPGGMNISGHVLRWGSPEKLMKPAYLVAQGYANFFKMVSMVILNLGRRLIAILASQFDQMALVT